MASMRIYSNAAFISRIQFCQAKYHYHKKRKHSPPISQISQPPSGAPAPGPSNEPPSKIGAVADGMTDDTEAFKTAWDTACQFEYGVILVPNGYSFMIQSTIFTGFCKLRAV
ncbi:hypothetical protein DCAR_0934147 [Daucus carota subsp. sativus]|uniref:Pectate lyase superfamily protein domain-containing protein n=1 Tax=Daucus carota subsp. sativus TaxID=79200 RepID=A0AAF0XWF1_DAUCS|nr:hypothetical protein DCAR_0934147 [Daucus carota subsp. sativus]